MGSQSRDTGCTTQQCYSSHLLSIIIRWRWNSLDSSPLHCLPCQHVSPWWLPCPCHRVTTLHLPRHQHQGQGTLRPTAGSYHRDCSRLPSLIRTRASRTLSQPEVLELLELWQPEDVYLVVTVISASDPVWEPHWMRTVRLFPSSVSPRK